MSISPGNMTDIAQRIPVLLGYAPTRHVVILGTAGPNLVVTAAYECGDAETSLEGATRVAGAAAKHGATGLVVVTYGLDVVTAARAVRDARDAAALHRIIIRETARVAHRRIWVGRERGEGHPMPEAPGPNAAGELVSHGSPAVTREALAASWLPTGSLAPDNEVTTDEGAQLWARLLRGEVLTETEQRKTLGMLATTPGRDGVIAAFGLFDTGEWPDELGGIAATVQKAIRGVPLSVPLGHLRHLVNACAPENAAEVLTVAAVLAWAGGNNTVAGLCSFEADKIQPGHQLARLVNLAIANDLPAPTVR